MSDERDGQPDGPPEETLEDPDARSSSPRPGGERRPPAAGGATVSGAGDTGTAHSRLPYETLGSIERWGDTRIGLDLAAVLGVLVSGGALVSLFSDGAGADGVVAGYPVALGVRVAAVIALVAFIGGRQGVLPRRWAGVVAASGSGMVVLGDILNALGHLSVWAQPAGLPIAGFLGLGGIGLGITVARGLSNGDLLRAMAGAAAVGGLGTVGLLLGSLAASLLSAGLAEAGVLATFGQRYMVLTLALGAALVVYAVLVLRYLLGGDLDFFDLSVPSLRDLGIAVLGFVTLFVLTVAISTILRESGTQMASSQIERQARQSADPTWVLYLIPLSFIAIAPGEEILYRNVVQKYLYGAMSRWGAVVVGSGLFAGMHFFQYLDSTPGATLVSLLAVFTLALVLGASYERTDNILVPIIIHGAFNALAFLGMYIRVTEGISATLV